MFYADTVGIFNVNRAMRSLAQSDSSWTPSPLIERLAAKNSAFNA
jgi:3-hydroxyacyl-CoA dehydrogenase